MGTVVLHCQPGAKHTRCVGLHDGKPKVQLKAPPVDGAANTALIAFLAEICGVPKSDVTLEHGASGRTKRVAVAGMDDEALLARLLATVAAS